MITNVAEGDVLYDGAERGSRSNGGYGKDTGCNIPGVSIRISGDVRKVRVGLKEGTRDLIVEDITMNNTVLAPPEDAGPPGSAFPTGFNTQAGWEWYVESLAKMVGINSIDDLTKTYARFNFKTANFTGGGPVYDGHDDGGKCWAADFPQPPFYYQIGSCTQPSAELSGPMEMRVEVGAKYYNTKKSHFDHDVTSRAIARDYHNMPDVFDANCQESGVPRDWGAGFECELYWELVGYN